jgi:3-deoxy-manno-octulosonate cytidylyltransferase (CMP-KDO synthetase)
LKTIAYIPARLQSTRFPEKILQPLHGKPLLAWAYENAVESNLFDDVILLADDERTVDLARSFKYHVRLTSKRPTSGTQRIIEAIKNGAPLAEKIVNVQADEPFVHKEMFSTLLGGDKGGARIWTLKKKIESLEEMRSPNVVKVVTNVDNEALFFSRHCIPFDRDNVGGNYFRHVGLYAYTVEALEKLESLEPCSLEQMEMLEQLTPLFHKIPIEVFETSHMAHGVDTPDDLKKVESILSPTVW